MLKIKKVTNIAAILALFFAYIPETISAGVDTLGHNGRPQNNNEPIDIKHQEPYPDVIDEPIPTIPDNNDLDLWDQVFLDKRAPRPFNTIDIQHLRGLTKANSTAEDKNAGIDNTIATPASTTQNHQPDPDELANLSANSSPTPIATPASTTQHHQPDPREVEDLDNSFEAGSIHSISTGRSSTDEARSPLLPKRLFSAPKGAALNTAIAPAPAMQNAGIDNTYRNTCIYNTKSST
ncbi:MAG UNVERIFIED_CONTAM: hypothetical protein LVQ98_03650 [Rickettsiaceae bacterium]|jgi:hypothetical protein